MSEHDEHVEDLPERLALSVVSDSPITKVMASNVMQPGAVTSANAGQIAPIEQGGPIEQPPAPEPPIAVDPQPIPVDPPIETIQPAP